MNVRRTTTRLCAVELLLLKASPITQLAIPEGAIAVDQQASAAVWRMGNTGGDE